MSRRDGEPVENWHARATGDYLKLAAQRAAGHQNSDDDGGAGPAASAAFREWHDASKAFLAELPGSGDRRRESPTCPE